MNKNSTLIKEFLHYKENIKKCSFHTIRAYRNDLNQYSKFLVEYNKNLLQSEAKKIYKNYY